MINHDQSGYPIIPDYEPSDSSWGELAERCPVCERINCICPPDFGLETPRAEEETTEETGDTL